MRAVRRAGKGLAARRRPPDPAGFDAVITMRALIERAERHFPANPAIVPAVAGEGGPLTWAALAVRVRQAAAVLRSFGVGAGDRFAIVCRNDPRQAELIHAGYWMGAAAAPINYRLAPVEIAAILDGLAPRAVVVEDHFADSAIGSALAQRAEPVLWIGTAGRPDGPVYEALRDAAHEDEGRVSVEGDCALILHTGGTTGRAKGVPLTHRNVAANGLQLVGPFGAVEDDVMLHVAPMFHSADLLGSPFSHTGAAHAYLPDFTPDAFLAAVARSRATFTMLSPTLIVRIVREGRRAEYDVSSLRRLTYGAAPMDAVWVRRTMEAFPGVELVQSYGLTETAPILTTLGWPEHVAGLEGGERLRSVGRPLVGVELRIVDEAGNDVAAPGEAGEIVVRGPNVASGYLDRPQETADAFRGGWFHTGDVGRLDGEGFLYVVDRKKDVIITGGENVWSTEVEAALYAHPEVVEAAVVGTPDETWGEALLAVVVPAPGSPLAAGGGADALVAHCRARIGGYKVPRRFRFVDALPKSAMGKVLKGELRRRYRDDPAAND